jgi:hypothetical protein
MQIYTVHINKDNPEPLENAIFVKEGFSIYAAIFQGFWALYHKMWLCAAALIVVNMCFIALEKYAIISSDMSTILQLGVLVFIGFEANDWYRLSLRNRGYELFEIVSGKNLDEAQYRFFSSSFDKNKMSTA